jgi:DNA polymerase sigma
VPKNRKKGSSRPKVKEEVEPSKGNLGNESQESSLNAQLELLYKRTKEDNRDRYRKMILNRLTHILSQVGVVCKPYGSFASQLSLPDSDLDLSIDSSVLNFFSL